MLLLAGGDSFSLCVLHKDKIMLPSPSERQSWAHSQPLFFALMEQKAQSC